MKIRTKHLLFSLLLLSFAITACVDHQERYEDPPWLGGTNIETLEKMGDYDIYLKLMEKAGYTISVEKILYTLFVPSDSAFEKYFEKIGISSVEELSDDQAFQLFTLHLLVNPRSRYHLIYEYVWSEEQGPTGEYAGLFLRKRTPSQSTPYRELPLYHDRYNDSIWIYTSEKYVPLWSKDYFEDYFAATDGSDYLFIYPGSNYDVTSPVADLAMNWHNAMVIANPDNPEELGVRTSSGFIYFLDQVVEPIQSLEEYMRDNLDKYGLFYDLMQRYADYGSARTVEVEENGELVRQVQYRKSYEYLANIADDAGPADGTEFRMKDMFTAFIPQDNVFQNYLDNNILNTYGEIDSIPEITMSYILRSHLNQSLGLVSKMEKGFFNDFGDPLTVTRDDINAGYMCSNGVLYDMKKVLEPEAFTSVTGDLFFDKKYSTFLFALNNVDLLTAVSSSDQEVTIFAPDNETLEASNVRYDSDENVIQYYGPDLKWRTMKQDQLLEFVQNHIVFDKITDFSGEGFIKLSSGNYIHYNSGMVEGPENQFLGDSANLNPEFIETENGVLYGLDNAIKSRYYSLGKLLHNNTTDSRQAETLTDTTLTEFSDLLEESIIMNRRIKDSQTKELIPKLKFTASSDAWTVFAPTNEAIREARKAGLIPGTRDSLIDFLEYHFVRDNVIFDDGDPRGTGTFSTQLLAPVVPDGPKYESLTIRNELYNMTVTDKSGQVVTIEHSNANMLAQKGVVHKINKVLIRGNSQNNEQ